jgi:putative ATPase
MEADITALDVDAIVNAANTHLQHGGGVAAAIARAGGPAIQRESDDWVRTHGPLESGAAAVTTAGDMAADLVVHVAGPRYRSGQDNAGLLGAAVHAALDAAAAHECATVAIPAISAGIYGYPLEEATMVIVESIHAWFADHEGPPSEVLLVGFDATVTAAFERAISNAT